MAAPAHNMKYRYLGDSGLLVSTLSFGSWVSFSNQIGFDQAYEILVHAYKHGVNFFDNAEVYAEGQSEVIMGQCIQRGIDEGVWTREDLVEMLSNGFDERVEKTRKLEEVAKEIGASNLKALEFIDKITPEIREKVDAIVQFVPQLLPTPDPNLVRIRSKFT
ncbi:hypothetical protein PybrP1_006975 [[Pythium] brassicae (nom. inval.)]|nr:hypothetical protein PybrP1_006975 [[Pythium] brassicae (nom. inval.)]